MNDRMLLAVDAPSLLHRNHHARRDSALRDAQGRPVWALHGMLRQILEAIDQFAPDAVLFGIDDRRSSVRETAYPDYKAGRAEKDPELVDQLERAADLLDALGLLTVTPEGLEADDVNASAATWAEEHGWRCVLITSDRDAFAHISETTQVLRLITGGINGSPLLNPARLHAMYGVAARNYLDFAALRGDASDNLPGVPGIGEKTAPVLLDVMGSMDAVWADIEHTGGAMLVATVDSWCEETGARRMGASLLKRLTAEGARERFDFNLSMMSGRTDLDLGLTPDVPGTPGLLPLDPERVMRVVGYLGVPATTDLALRVLTEAPASQAPVPIRMSGEGIPLPPDLEIPDDLRDRLRAWVAEHPPGSAELDRQGYDLSRELAGHLAGLYVVDYRPSAGGPHVGELRRRALTEPLPRWSVR